MPAVLLASSIWVAKVCVKGVYKDEPSGWETSSALSDCWLGQQDRTYRSYRFHQHKAIYPALLPMPWA